MNDRIELDVETILDNWVEFWAGYIHMADWRLRSTGHTASQRRKLLREDRDALCGDNEEARATWDAAVDFLEDHDMRVAA